MVALSTISAAPQWTMTGKPRTASVGSRPIVPDPGQYAALDPTATSKMQRTAIAGFSALKSRRAVLAEDNESKVPGPGQYNHHVNDDLGQIPHQTSAVLATPRSRARVSRESTPDPGCYTAISPQTTSKMGRSPSYGFASSRMSRFPMLKERVPGPGAYANGDQVGRNGGISFDRGPPRRASGPRPETPDPGAYHALDPSGTSRMPRSPRASLDSRSRTGREVENGERKNGPPGPGAYAHKDIIGDSLGASFQRSAPRKDNSARSHVADVIYNPTDPSATSKMYKQASYGFGNLNTGRVPDKSAVNGFDKTEDSIDENGVRNGPAVNGVRSPRQSPRDVKRDVPGPGTYTVMGSEVAVARSSPNYGFGSMDARPRSAQTLRVGLQTPGPGTYVRGTMVGGGGPKFSMRGRTDKSAPSTPGPGSYGGHYTQFVTQPELADRARQQGVV